MEVGAQNLVGCRGRNAGSQTDLVVRVDVVVRAQKEVDQLAPGGAGGLGRGAGHVQGLIGLAGGVECAGVFLK